MIRGYNNYSAKKSVSREPLPAGGYVCRILDVKIQNYTWGDVIVLSLDVVEGQYKDFFRKDYQAQSGEDKKWRGTLRLNIPKDDGSEKDAWTKRTFENAMWAFEASNNGYHFDWDEQKLKNLLVGVLYRNKEWEMNGNRGWTTESCAATSVEDIRSGNYKMPKDKPLSASANPAAAGGYQSFASIGDDDELPF